MNVHRKSISFLKAFSWRILATFATISISYFITHQVRMAVAIGSIEFFMKIGLYYVHERIWIFVACRQIKDCK